MPSLTSESDPARRFGRPKTSIARRWGPLVPLVLAAWLTPGMAHALPSDADRATARALAREGYEAEKQGNYALAAERFVRAEALVPAPTLLLGLARAQVGLGKLVEAEETYQRILREGVQPGAPSPFAKALEDAKHEAPTLATRIAWVTVEVQGPATPMVLVDGTAIPSAAFGVRRPYDPGPHTVHVSADGFAPADRAFVVAEGQAETVALAPSKLPDAPDPVEPLDAPSPAPPAAEPTPLGAKLGIVALGLGGWGLLVGGVAGTLVLTKHASLSDVCPSGHCSPSESNELRQYDTLGTLSTAAIIGGACTAAAGVGLLLSTRKTSSVTAQVGFLRVGLGATF
jgi:hypothetical protein